MLNKQEARLLIKKWCEEVEQSKIKLFMVFARIVKAYLSGIMNFVETRITNARFESILASAWAIKILVSKLPVRQ